VYHYYGSKQNLLDAATTPPQSFLDEIATAWQAPPAELGGQLVRQMLRNWTTASSPRSRRPSSATSTATSSRVPGLRR
jgi:hypothetical protein